MRILAIETSCDETAIAVLDATGSKKNPVFRPLANVVSSQIAIHKKFGGVVPNLAKREHQRNLAHVLLRALEEARLQKSKLQNPKSKQISKSQITKIEEIFSHEPELLKNFKSKILRLPAPDIDAIAVTYGPGLAPALWTGVNFAKALSLIWNKPLIPVNHLAGHIYVNMVRGKNISFPALALIVSGGHTELVLMNTHNSYQVIGETRDDAAGEAFDKVARLLKLGYPGGPEISKRAELGDKTKIPFPFPMINSDDFDFSFSGLKTAVLYKLREIKPTKTVVNDISASFQESVANVLVKKTIRAAKKYKATTIILGGGVAANKKLREYLSMETERGLPNTALLLPEIKETTDNALMIAAAAFFAQKKLGPARALSLSADPGLRLSASPSR